MTTGGMLTDNADLTYNTIGSILTVPSITSTAVVDFGGVTRLRIVQGTGPAADFEQIGDIGWETTSGNLVIATSTVAGKHVVLSSATTTLYAFSVASTSPDMKSGGIIYLPAHFLAQNATAIICQADAGTSVVINLSNEAGSSDSNAITCSTTSTQYSFTSNSSYAAYAVPRLEFGTVTGAVDAIIIRIVGYRSSN